MIPTGLHDWAAAWGVSAEALADLSRRLGLMGGPPPPPPDRRGIDAESEAYVQSLVRLEAPRAGCVLWRNNVGVLEDKTGRPVRYGLGNDTPALNKVLKSADLIGWRRVTVEPRHLGTVIAQFVSRECKRAGWSYTGDEREIAQLAWANRVNADGGDAQFTTGPGSL